MNKLNGFVVNQSCSGAGVPVETLHYRPQLWLSTHLNLLQVCSVFSQRESPAAAVEMGFGFSA